jgi:hypothetical protein
MSKDRPDAGALLDALQQQQSIANERKAHHNLQASIRDAANNLRLIPAKSDPLHYYAPRAFRQLLCKPWGLAQLVRRWKDDPAPPLPEEAELPDREATRKTLQTLLAWEQTTLERFEQEIASALDTPDEPPQDAMRFEKLTPKQNELMRLLVNCNGKEVSIRDAMEATGKQPASQRERRTFITSIRRLNERLAYYYKHFEVELDRKAKTIRLVKT